MGDEAPEPSADGDASSSNTARSDPATGDQVVNVAEQGDIILDVTFELSERTLQRPGTLAAAAAAAAAARTLSNGQQPRPILTPRLQMAYRVSSDVLKRHSAYFANLLTNPAFRESVLISAARENLLLRGIEPADADPSDLPRVLITDDDEATQSAGRELAFEDMLRIVHQRPVRNARPLMLYVTTLAVTADRFDCTPAVARALAEIKFKWPLTSTKPYLDEAGRPTDVEGVLRQKVLTAWLLGENAHADLEELRHRRECILNAVSSIQTHFLSLYSSRDRQCKLGYDSSPACDSFQFGQMLKFLLSRRLLFLVDFSTASAERLPDTSLVDVEELLATLKQCPNYQLDKHHMNCGLRIRIDPILDYVRAMLSAQVISIPLADWKRTRADVSWVSGKAADNGQEGEARAFAFTRALANDQRLRYEGAMHADKMARSLFTADTWDWTPEL
ncbi:hypothetical protein UVI_02000810 [Ustilaginoidea virens]|uniref:Uncharacterized protein n=1 Tax=Ustilaginoidea virens TaxID=1159556 RepID=A0A1B5L4N3_USTVR|nr:hypothetical protein UVI_02000810 [Ustilaginoidea virens]